MKITILLIYFIYDLVIPHITDAIQEWVQRVAHVPVTPENTPPRVCIVELGGTIGDIEGMSFVEAFRQFQFRVKKENFCCAHVSLVPMVSNIFFYLIQFLFSHIYVPQQSRKRDPGV